MCQKTASDTKMSFLPRYPAWHLRHKLFVNINPSFCLLTSSMTSLFRQHFILTQTAVTKMQQIQYFVVCVGWHSGCCAAESCAPCSRLLLPNSPITKLYTVSGITLCTPSLGSSFCPPSCHFCFCSLLHGESPTMLLPSAALPPSCFLIFGVAVMCLVQASLDCLSQ